MTLSRVCIVGPGAIGGMMAVKLAYADFVVSALVRPHRVDSMNRDGITLLDGDETFHSVPNAAANSEDLGAQDLVVITVKETALKDVAPMIAPLLAADTQLCR